MKNSILSLFPHMMVIVFCLFIFNGCAARYGQVVLEDERGTVSVEVEKGPDYETGHHGHKHRHYKTNLPEIPPGHMPPPGKCRIWIPGKPPGQQSPPGDCYDLERRIPPGAWLIRG